MRPNLKFILRTNLGIVILFIYCEYLIFYHVQKDCDWPILDPIYEDKSIENTHEEPVKVLVIADTHLLGSRRGHWFDKLRREWQMYRSFQTAMTLHNPDVVFVLGDLTDEGLYCSKDEFDYYVKRFYSIFSVPDTTKLYVTVGNHDIGFHSGISPYLNQRFVNAFNAPAVQIISIRGNHFVLLNSMALQGDGCFLCRPAEIQLSHIEKLLKCSKGNFTNKKCDNVAKLDIYSKPILMQHFPLYRQSDMECNEFDSAPLPLKTERFREGWECLSQEASNQILNQIRPRLVMAGHTHHGCIKPLATGEGYEYTISSFSWRNKDNPTYALALIMPNNYAIYKCAMPQESTVFNLYIFGTICFLIYFIHTTIKKKTCNYIDDSHLSPISKNASLNINSSSV